MILVNFYCKEFIWSWVWHKINEVGGRKNPLTSLCISSVVW